MLNSRFLAAVLVCLTSLPSLAQFDAGLQGTNESPFGLNFGGAAEPDSSIEYSASYQLNEAGTAGKLSVTAQIGDGYHTYSITQPDGGPLPTEIAVKDDNIQLAGPFTANKDAEIATEDGFDVKVHQYGESVTWSAPFKTKKPVDSKQKIALAIEGQVCGHGSCLPVGEKLEAEFAGRTKSTSTAKSLRAGESHAVWTASLENASVKPGETTQLKITCQLDPGYHVYQFVPGEDETLFRTLIVASQKSSLKFGEPKTDGKLETDSLDEDAKYYAKAVTWAIPVTVPETAQEGQYPLSVSLGFGTCNENGCDERLGVVVSGDLTVANKTATQSVAFGLSETTFVAVADLPNLSTWIDAPIDTPAEANTPLTLWHLLAAIGGGFILNFMPCVLPVIGLKILSFADQAGNNPRRVIMLNLAFSGGILAVMVGLAVLSIGVKMIWGQAFGWGEQFSYLEFKVVLAALIFAMALSFLGVWEIPIPGFAMSSKSGELMEKEGYAGAFLKGIITTVLATPCSGPLLGALLGLSLTMSPLSILILYIVVGLGMALPYLAICIRPSLVNLLPKPGAWMETLKQVLAFPLLFTVIFFVFCIDADHRIATLLLLIFVWFACWFVGKVPAYANADKRMTAWAAAVVVIALGCVVSFKFFGPIDHKFEWVAYNEPELKQLRSEGKTVMLDFTANWCLVCQANMLWAIDKENVAAVVKENEVVPMIADWTDRSNKAIRNKLNELGSNAIPLLVIYPPDPEAEPIILHARLSEAQVLEALKQAGPSRPASQLTTTSVH